MVRQLRIHGRVMEPPEDFYKDEVRALGRELGPPAEKLERHPFPGSGLSIRIIYDEEPFLEADFDETKASERYAEGSGFGSQKIQVTFQYKI
ncbi:putative GMP synthase [Daphnia magna]|uniref:Putative GMP synthase n=1 Tax=Daphnia magna TaxID=35525 RepID=A0A164HX60_9CRUS|nr:putative GMP synthase [Daphnia magna]